VATKPKEAMAAFDSLPKPIRERLSNAKFPISPIDALIIYQRNGLAFTLNQIDVTERNIERKSPYV